MSRIGRQPVPVPANVTVSVASGAFSVKGPKGELSFPLLPEVSVEVADSVAKVVLTGKGSASEASARHGLVRAHLANMVQGVTDGYSKSLEIIGVGWGAKPAGQGIDLEVGFCHPVHFDPPAGISIALDSQTKITVSGADKQAVGQLAASIRRVRPPEPYKGKGIRYQDEFVRRKVGKSLS